MKIRVEYTTDPSGQTCTEDLKISLPNTELLVYTYKDSPTLVTSRFMDVITPIIKQKLNNPKFLTIFKVYIK